MRDHTVTFAVGPAGTGKSYLAVALAVQSLQAKQVNRIDIYKQAAAATKTPLPKDVFRTAKLMDGVVWDGKDAKKYAGTFKIRVA